MSKVALVTDSTAYIPAELSKQATIETVPLQVIWGDETQRDGVDIQPAQFYQRLQTTRTLPTTSQPSPAAFKGVYEKLLSQGYQILSVHISSKLSGTVDSAQQARNMLPNAPIEIIDSQLTSMGMGYPVLIAARAAEQGATLQECKILAEQACHNSGIIFAVNTLEFLHRGGRIGGAAAFLGTALNLKPLLELRGGRIEAVERIRTMSKATERLLDLIEQRVGARTPIHLAAVHAAGPEMAEALLEKARARFSLTAVNQTAIADVSPVIGVHTGPGCVGLTFTAGM